MRCRSSCVLANPASLILFAGLLLASLPRLATAATVSFSGIVSYDGPYAGNDLYVAVLDTTGGPDVTVLVIGSYSVSSLPFAQPFALDFDNVGAASEVVVAALLDVDGSGVGDVSGADVFGWYAGTSTPTFISSAGSQTGLDFSLPKAEIHGTLTFGPGQSEARVDITDDLACVREGLRPQPRFSSSGSYSIVGIYAGTYCVNASGSGLGGYSVVCFGDPDCVSPTSITLGPSEIRTGVDLDFSALVAVEESSWGRLKASFR
jgi:hypothetical protein